MKGRMYDPSLRQVLTPDPLASAATNSGIHPYAYVMNDPVNFFDPTGFSACDVGTCDVFGSFSADPGPGGHYGWAYTGSWDTQTHNVSDYDWRWIENSRNVPVHASSAQLFGGSGATFQGALGLSTTAGSHDDSRSTGSTQSSIFSPAQLSTAQAALGAVSMLPGWAGVAAGTVLTGLFVYRGDYGLAAISAAGAVASIVGMQVVATGALGSGKLGQAFAAIGRYFGGGKGAPEVGRVFWSGGKASKDAAATFAKRTGGQTLEMTPTGRALEAMPRATSGPLWGPASKEFAEGTTATADVFIGRVGTGSIWNTIERPTLTANAVTIRTHLTVIQ